MTPNNLPKVLYTEQELILEDHNKEHTTKVNIFAVGHQFGFQINKKPSKFTLADVIKGLEGVVRRMKEKEKNTHKHVVVRFEAKLPNSLHVENWLEEFGREEWDDMTHTRRCGVLKDRLANRMTWNTQVMFTPPEPPTPIPEPKK